MTWVGPIGKSEPEGGVQTTAIVPSTASVAVAVYVTTVPDGLVGSTLMSAGRTRTGRGSGMSVIVKLPEDCTPNAFVAVQLTVVVPIGKNVSDAGEQTTAASWFAETS